MFSLGYTATSHYKKLGSGANYICLTNHPELPDGPKSFSTHTRHASISGVEYKRIKGHSSLTDHDAPCTVCRIKGRGEQLMIPGTRSCPNMWTKEYEGLLVSTHRNWRRSTYVCLNKDLETLNSGGKNQEGGTFYNVVPWCGPLPCPPYKQDFELFCVVCTR